MTTGQQIQINNGQIETLIKIHDGYGLFVCNKYKVVRQLSCIVGKETI